MASSFLSLFILIMMNSVQGYKKTGFAKGGNYGYKFTQPLKVLKRTNFGYYPTLPFSYSPYWVPSFHIYKPFTLSPYTLHKKIHFTKMLSKKDYYRIPKFYRPRKVDFTKEPSLKTLVWDSSKSIFVRPGEVRTTFDVPKNPFSLERRNENPEFNIYTRTFSPDGGRYREQFPVDGNIPAFTESFPNMATQTEPVFGQMSDNRVRNAGPGDVLTGNDILNPAESVSDSAGFGIALPSETSSNISPNTDNILTTDGHKHIGHKHITPPSEVSANRIPVSPSTDSKFLTTSELAPLAEVTDTSSLITIQPNTTIGIDVTPSMGIVDTLQAHVHSRLPNEGLPISVDLFNSVLSDQIRTPGVQIEAGLPDIGAVRSISANDAIVVDNQFINNGGGVNLVSDVVVTPGLTVVDVNVNERQLKSDSTTDNGVAIINGQTAVPVASIENPFLEPMEHMGAFGPGPYYTCHPPSRVVCNANSDWFSVFGIDEWCKQNCVVDNYSSYCDDDRCSCKCVENE